MRMLSKLMLLVLLAIPMGAYAASATAVVNIDVTITGTVDIVFDDGAAHNLTTRSWSFSSGLASSPDSTTGVITEGAATLTNAVGLNIKNKTVGIPVDLTAAVTGSGNWTNSPTVAGLGAQNLFAVTASVASGAFQELSTFSISNLAANATTVANQLKFYTPTTVSTIHSGAIVVTYTATLH